MPTQPTYRTTDPSNVLEVLYRPLWYHVAGLQQAASGYGSRLTTPVVVRYRHRNGRSYLHRVYVVCYSNAGTGYIRVEGRPVYLDHVTAWMVTGVSQRQKGGAS